MQHALERAVNGDIPGDVVLDEAPPRLPGQVRDEWVEIDPTRQAAMTIPFAFNDIGADGVAGTSDD